MEHIQTIELGSSQASIEFTSIPQDYDDLVVLMSTRDDAAGVNNLRVTLNSSADSHTAIGLYGTGSSVNSASDTNFGSFSYMYNDSGTSNTFSNNQMYISNYSSTSVEKSISTDSVSENNATEAFSAIQAAIFTKTEAIHTIKLFAGSKDLVAGSTASLYGVTAGGDGTVTTA